MADRCSENGTSPQYALHAAPQQASASRITAHVPQQTRSPLDLASQYWLDELLASFGTPPPRIHRNNKIRYAQVTSRLLVPPSDIG